jgi:hypothetical protein
MLLNDFSAGLNLRVAPSLLQQTESQVYTNIDNAKGSLTPLKSHTLDTQTVSKFFTWYYAQEEWVSSATEASYVEFRNILYATQDGSYPTKYDGTNTYRLGIVGPTNSLSIAQAYDPVISDSSGASLPPNTYKYRIYRVDVDVEGESFVDIKEAEYTIDTYRTVDFATASATATTSVYREWEGVYRLVATGTTANIQDLVYDISANTVWDDTINIETISYVYTYYDSVKGVESTPSEIQDIVVAKPVGDAFDLRVLTVTGYVASTDPQVTNIRLYRLGSTITSYTLVDTLAPDATTYTDDNVDEDVVGNHILDTINATVAPTGLMYLTEAYAMLFGVLNSKLYYSNIGSPDEWPAESFVEFDAELTGVAPIQNGIVVFTKFKTYLVTGNTPGTFSKFLIDSSHGCESHYTIQFVDNSLIWLAEDGICTTSGGIVDVLTTNKLGKLALTGIQNAQVMDRVYYLAHDAGIFVFDFRFIPIIRNITTIPSWLGAYKDKLYYSDGIDIYSMFTSNDDLNYSYKSPVLTEGSYSNRKIYKDFYIKYNGAVVINILLDGVSIHTKNLTGDKCENLKAIESAEGYGLEIELSGTGIVSEIEYKVQGRDNGK